MCGVLGVVSRATPVAEDTYAGLWSLQHRGKESAGIVTYDKESRGYFDKIGMGTVEVVFGHDALLNLRGSSGIGHVRYSTTGSSSLENAHPVSGYFRGTQFWIAHNGNLVDIEGLRKELEERGYHFYTSTDTEIIAALIYFSSKEKFEDALKDALGQVKGTYALTVLYENDVYGARDKTGNRPLVVGFGRGIMVLASESAACDVLGIQLLRDVNAGEMVILRGDSFSMNFRRVDGMVGPLNTDAQKPCLFEYVYFQRPDSLFYNRRIQSVRERMGYRLWEESPVNADVVVPVPDSGNFAACGFARGSGLPLIMAFFRSHYVGRTFIEPLHERREKGLRIKLNLIPELVEGRRVVVVDDSIVRATVSKRVVKMLRSAGAREVHGRISSPPYRYPCYYGIDTYRIGEKLVAGRLDGNVEAIRREIGFDSLHYLSLGSLVKAVVGGGNDGLRENNFCHACFSGEYHIPLH